MTENLATGHKNRGETSIKSDTAVIKKLQKDEVQHPKELEGTNRWQMSLDGPIPSVAENWRWSLKSIGARGFFVLLLPVQKIGHRPDGVNRLIHGGH